jgi:hypothetical protein
MLAFWVLAAHEGTTLCDNCFFIYVSKLGHVIYLNVGSGVTLPLATPLLGHYSAGLRFCAARSEIERGSRNERPRNVQTMTL